MTFTFTPLRTPIPTALAITWKSSNSEILSSNIILTTVSRAFSLITFTSKSSNLWPYQDFSWPEFFIPSWAYLLTQSELGGLLELSVITPSMPLFPCQSTLSVYKSWPRIYTVTFSLLLHPGSWVLLEKTAEMCTLDLSQKAKQQWKQQKYVGWYHSKDCTFMVSNLLGLSIAP